MKHHWKSILLTKLIQVGLLAGVFILLRIYKESIPWLLPILLVPMMLLIAFVISDWETSPRDMLKYGGMVFAILPMAAVVKLLFISPFLIGFGIAFWIYGAESLGMATLFGWGIVILVSFIWAGIKKWKKEPFWELTQRKK